MNGDQLNGNHIYQLEIGPAGHFSLDTVSKNVRWVKQFFFPNHRLKGGSWFQKLAKLFVFILRRAIFARKYCETQKLQLLKNVRRDFDETCGKPSREPNEHLCQKCLKSVWWFPSPQRTNIFSGLPLYIRLELKNITFRSSFEINGPTQTKANFLTQITKKVYSNL